MIITSETAGKNIGVELWRIINKDDALGKISIERSVSEIIFSFFFKPGRSEVCKNLEVLVCNNLSFLTIKADEFL